MKSITLLLTALLLIPMTGLRAEDAAPAKPAAKARPNILWLISEDTGPQLNCYGVTKQVWTPNLDKLAAEGARYTHFYDGMVCSVSRSSFMTGMYAVSIDAQNHRSHHDGTNPLPDGVRVLTGWMRDAGYFTANVVNLPKDCGFRGTGKTDWNFAHKGKPFDSENWDDLKSHQPFYAQINFHETHRPYGAPQRADPAKVDLPPYYPDHPIARADWAKYLDSLSELDSKIGRVMQQLEKDGLADSTVIVYFGDNGISMVRGKQFCYEEGFIVPLIIRWPKNFSAPKQITPGTVDTRMIDGIDLAPTMLAIAGAAKPAKMQGRIFLGENAEPARDFIFGSRDRCDETVMRIRSVRDERYRYIRNFTPNVPFLAPNAYKERSYPVWNLLKQLHAEGKLTPAQDFLCQPTRPSEELYDMQTDPNELVNLAAVPEQQENLKRLRGVLEKWIVDVDDKGQTPEAADAGESSGKKTGKKAK